MEYNELERILLYLSNSLNESNDTIFKEKVSYFKSELERLKYNIPSIEEIEKLHKLEIELETKYDLLLEFSLRTKNKKGYRCSDSLHMLII